jgi:hypothetical protein
MSNEFKNNKKDTVVGDKTSAKEDVNSKNSNVENQKNKNAPIRRKKSPQKC